MQKRRLSALHTRVIISRSRHLRRLCPIHLIHPALMLSQHRAPERIPPTRYEGWFGHDEGFGGAVIQVLGVDFVGFLAAVGEGGCDAGVALCHEEEGRPGEDPEEG